MNGCLGSRATPLQVNTATSFFITSQTTHCTNWTIHTNHPFINPITRLTIAVVRLLLKQHITILNATEQNFTKLVQITVTCSPHSHHISTHPPTHPLAHFCTSQIWKSQLSTAPNKINFFHSTHALSCHSAATLHAPALPPSHRNSWNN